VAFDPGVTESGLGFSLNYQVAEFASQPSVRNELRRRALRRFMKEGIKMPFPTRTVYMHPGEGTPLADARGSDQSPGRLSDRSPDRLSDQSPDRKGGVVG
jgi:small-conductance mechanosensitive channel